MAEEIIISESDEVSDDESYATLIDRKKATHLKKQKALTKRKADAKKQEPPAPKRARKPVEVIDIDFDDSFSLESSARRGGRKTVAERIAEMQREVSNDAYVNDAFIPGDKPKNFYPTPQLDEITKSIEQTSRKEVNIVSIDDDDLCIPTEKRSHACVEKIYFFVWDLDQAVRFRFEIAQNATFQALREKLAAKWGCSVKEVGLRYDKKELTSTSTPDSIKLFDMKTVEAYTVKATVDKDDLIQLKFLVEGRRKHVILSVEKTVKVSELREQVAKEIGKAPSELSVRFDGDICDDDDTPMSMELEDDDCFDIHLAHKPENRHDDKN